MTSSVLNQHVELLLAVRENDYYVDLVEKELSNFSIEILRPEDVCSFWNNVWTALPDSPEIRRPPFFQICDLAEGDYLEEE